MIVQFFHAKDFKQQFVSLSLVSQSFSIEVNLSGKHKRLGFASSYQTTITGSTFALWLFEKSTALFCSHLLSMIQACTHHSAIMVKLIIVFMWFLKMWRVFLSICMLNGHLRFGFVKQFCGCV